MEEIGYECFSNNKIDEIKIPETVKKIGKDAFDEC